MSPITERVLTWTLYVICALCLLGLAVSALSGCGAAGKRVARSVRVEVGTYDGTLATGPRRDFDNEGTYLGISFEPLAAIEPDPLVVHLESPYSPPSTGFSGGESDARLASGGASAGGGPALGGPGPPPLPLPQPRKESDPVSIPAAIALCLASVGLGAWQHDKIRKLAGKAWSLLGRALKALKAPPVKARSR